MAKSKKDEDIVKDEQVLVDVTDELYPPKTMEEMLESILAKHMAPLQEKINSLQEKLKESDDVLDGEEVKYAIRSNIDDSKAVCIFDPDPYYSYALIMHRENFTSVVTKEGSVFQPPHSINKDRTECCVTILEWKGQQDASEENFSIKWLKSIGCHSVYVSSISSIPEILNDIYGHCN